MRQKFVKVKTVQVIFKAFLKPEGKKFIKFIFYIRNVRQKFRSLIRKYRKLVSKSLELILHKSLSYRKKQTRSTYKKLILTHQKVKKVRLFSKKTINIIKLKQGIIALSFALKGKQRV